MSQKKKKTAWDFGSCYQVKKKKKYKSEMEMETNALLIHDLSLR